MAGLFFFAAGSVWAGDSIQLRVAWGGSLARLWRGTVTLDQGQLGEPHPLGIHADEPGSIWLEGSAVVVRQRSPRLYDGFDVLVHGPVDRAKLRVSLTADDEPTPVEIEIPLADVLDNSVNTKLDEHGTRLLVRRSPGDALRVEFDRRHLVFAPGEEFSFRVAPNLSVGGDHGSRRLKVQVLNARGERVLWERESTTGPVVPVRVPLPGEEGVYDLLISLIETPSLRLRNMGSVPLTLKPKTIARRKIQLIVLDPSVPAVSSQGGSPRVVEEIDPANPRWWERLARPSHSLPKLPIGGLSTLGQGPLGSGDMQVRSHSLGSLAELSPSRLPDSVSWEAYTLPIRRPGKPHILEVEYPSDLPQQLGISVLEPNAADALMPIQLDSGVSLAEEIVAAETTAPRMLRHRLIFWPHTRSPIVLITNQSSRRPAVYGKIRVLAGWEHLPPRELEADLPGRLLAAYFDRPLFVESFCGTEAYDAWSQRSLDDWVTFHEGGTRLIEYLRHVGMNGVMISVFSEGGALYPSDVLQPTPRYDKGRFFDSGQDPVSKDILEMLLRLADRQGMRVIPAMEFASPLPELEAMLRAGGPESAGIEWVGPDGLTWNQVYPPHRRMAPYYNLLHPRVQEAVIRAVRELVEGYASRHESFGGVAIQLAGHGYASLPDARWGMDDVTVARFEAETGVKVPGGAGSERFAERHVFLTGPGRRAWLTWRADCLARFYRRLQSEMAAVDGKARVYLATANLFAGPAWEERLRPTLSRGVTADEPLLEAGIDPAQFDATDGPVLIGSRGISTADSIEAQAVEWALQQSAGAAPRERDGAAGLFAHAPRELRIESFDRKSPYRSSYTMLRSQLVPSNHQNRRRFVRELAKSDLHAIFDGGELLPMGQEDALSDLVAAYRRLPAIPMRRVPSPAPLQSIQPVTIRHGSHGGKTYLYAVNDSPVSVSLSLRVLASADCRVESLVESRPVAGLAHSGGKAHWRVELGPYDLVAARFTDPKATFGSPEVVLPAGVRDALWARIHDLGERSRMLLSPPAFSALSNPDFEQSPASDGSIPGWIASKTDHGGVELHRDPNRAGGSRVARLVGAGSTVSLMSEPFTPPTTGRLSLFVHLRVPDETHQPSVELVVEGQWNGEPLSPRVGVLGRRLDGYPTEAIPRQWKQFFFPIENLPLDGLANLQVGLRLIGPGEVWIDDVELRHLEFQSEELLRLSRIISSADMKLQTNQYSDCIQLLEGYWPRFLAQNVPLPVGVARRPAPTHEPEPSPPEKPAATTGVLDRMRDLVPRKLW
ncbi:MAG: family 10 glycosylhydrolase [Pirellulaceae bacterium]|nr:family 10 glycosylhydrolase [Pirellulaceae bacterium]